jgi:hypothetical protein
MSAGRMLQNGLISSTTLAPGPMNRSNCVDDSSFFSEYLITFLLQDVFLLRHLIINMVNNDFTMTMQ